MNTAIDEFFDIIWNFRTLIEEFDSPHELKLFINGKYDLKKFEDRLKYLSSSIISTIEPNGDKNHSILVQLSESLNDFVFVEIEEDKYLFQLDYYYVEAGQSEKEKIFIANDNKVTGLLSDYHLFSKLKYDYTNKIIDHININQDSNHGSKLKIKMSVNDLALLFRLLDEENLIDYRHKTEIYRHISNNLKTTQQDIISEASVKNKFLSPDNTAIKNLNILLTNLKITLNKLN
jgi:hypothetical protein